MPPSLLRDDLDSFNKKWSLALKQTEVEREQTGLVPAVEHNRQLTIERLTLPLDLKIPRTVNRRKNYG